MLCSMCPRVVVICEKIFVCTWRKHWAIDGKTFVWRFSNNLR